jgi:TonB family protein
VESRAHRGKRGAAGARRWLFAALLSLAVHGALLLVAALTGFGALLGTSAVPKPAKVNPVSMRSVSPSAWEQNRKAAAAQRSQPSQAAAHQAQPAPPEPPKPKEPDEIPKGRVVDVAPGNGEKPPDDSRFLADRNNRVEKESISKDRTLNYRNATARPTTTIKENENARGRDAVDKPVIAGNDGQGDDEREKAEARSRAVFELPSVQHRERLALKFDGLGGELANQEAAEETRGNSDRLRIQAGGEQGGELNGSLGKAGTRELRTLTPSAAVLDRIIGAPASDVTPMDDADEGDGTYLNTREWKHASFFNRIKQNVGMHWNPNLLLRRRDPTGEVFLYKDRYTVVSVILDSSGALKDVAIDKSSGVDFLDGEAIAAFRRAQPFPNPPPALQDSRGEIRFTFGFYLEVGRMRLFR